MTIQQETKAKVQSTEAGAIPDDWRAVPFRHVVGTCLDFRGRTPKKLGLDWGGGEIVALSANNVQMGFIDFDRESYLGDELLYSKWMTNGDCELGDVLLTMEAPLGNVAQVPDRKRYILSQRVILVRPSPDVCKDFLAHQMRSERFQKELVKNASGSTALGIQRARLDQIPIALPSSTREQKLISVALTEATALVDSLEQLLTKKRQIKQGAMQELLTGKRRLPGFARKWKDSLLGELLSIRHGKSQKDVECEGGRYPILATGGQIGWADAFLYDQPTVLIGRKGTIDQPRFMDTPFWSVDTLYYSEVKEPNSAKFLYYRFCLIDWMRHNEASGVPSLSGKVIESIVISHPEEDEQEAIALVLTDMDAEITTLESRLTKARALKQAMAQALLTGRIRLVEPTK